MNKKEIQRKNIRSEALRLREDLTHKGKEVAILVESERDKIFWKTLLEAFLPKLKGKIDTPFFSQSSGKGEALKYKEFVDKSLIIARDSDNEYLYKEDDTYNKPFIYHTHYYNIENHLCYSENLNQIIYETTLCEYDFGILLTEYSKITFPILLYWLYFKKINYHIPALSWKEHQDEENEMVKLLSIEKDIENITTKKELDLLFLPLRGRVITFIGNIHTQINNEGWLADFLQEQQAYKLELQQKYLHLSEQTTLFYLSGHIIFPCVIEPLLRKVNEILRTDYENNIKSYISNSTKNQENKLKEYRNLMQDISPKLSDSFKGCLINTTNFEVMQSIKEKMAEELA